MKLRNMSATVEHVASITLRLENGENLQLENAYVLTSYASRVAVFCKMRCYLLPRYDYSATTWKHVHAFIDDFCDCVPDMSAADIRATAKGADDDSPYWFAAGIVEGIAPEYCNCEGCVNFPCVGVCGLSAYVERY